MVNKLLFNKKFVFLLPFSLYPIGLNSENSARDAAKAKNVYLCLKDYIAMLSFKRILVKLVITLCCYHRHCINHLGNTRALLRQKKSHSKYIIKSIIHLEERSKVIWFLTQQRARVSPKWLICTTDGRNKCEKESHCT